MLVFISIFITSQVQNFQPIPFVEGRLPQDIDNFELSVDERYLYEISFAVSSGVCSTTLANKQPGPIHHARWLTKANRVLREYVSNEKPSKNLIDVATYIMRVYVPTYFNVKYKPSCTHGSIHFFNVIKYSEYLPPRYLNIVKQVWKDNSYFANSENILLAMIFDANPTIRQMGYKKILKSRDESDQEFGVVREYLIPRILYDCENYYELIDWDLGFTEPPFTLSKSYDEIRMLYECSGIITDNITEIPCHTQATERHIKAVTQVSTSVASQERREGMVLSAIASRQKRQKFDSKQDFN